MVDRTTQMQRLLDFYTGHLATYVIRLGVQSGIFAALASHREGITGAQLAGELGLHGPYVESYLRTAYALHLLDRDHEADSYAFAPHMRDLLAEPESSRYLGDLATLILAVGDDFARMPDLMASGGQHPYPEHGDALVDAVADSTASIARFVARAAAPRLPGLRGRKDVDVLDIGCGSGTAMLAMAEAFPEGHILGIDVEPRSVDRANARIREARLEGRVVARLADAVELDLEESFDLVTLIQVLHEIDADARKAVLEQARVALRPGGLLLVVDEPYPNAVSELRQAPVSVLTQFIEAFWGNVFLSQDQQQELVEETGFRVLSQMVPPPGLICMTTAQRL